MKYKGCQYDTGVCYSHQQNLHGGSTVSLDQTCHGLFVKVLLRLMSDLEFEYYMISY